VDFKKIHLGLWERWKGKKKWGGGMSRKHGGDREGGGGGRGEGC
jgi:hypothetical protein